LRCSEAEKELAGTLIQAASQPIPWSEYRDDCQDQLHRLVEATFAGRKLEAPVEEEVPVLQLLDALKQSVTQALVVGLPGCAGERGHGDEVW
jgi:non-homologous end joining protein Ku